MAHKLQSMWTKLIELRELLQRHNEKIDDTSEKLLYQDDSETCFKITPFQQPCSKKTKEYPMQSLLFNN